MRHEEHRPRSQACASITVWAPTAATCTILVGEASCSGVLRSVVSPRPSCPQSLLPVAHACTLTHSKRTHTHRTATSAVQVQCEQRKSSAASERYRPRARNADDHNGAVQAISPSPRQTLPRTPAHNARSQEHHTRNQSAHTQAPLARACGGKRQTRQA